MKKLFKFFLFFFFSLVITQSVNATHIMGGNLYYSYIGFNPGNGQYQYSITLKMYRYCAAGSAALPTTVDLGVYIQDFLNPNNPVKNRQSAYVLTLQEQNIIDPPNANDSCTFVPSVCVEEGIYSVSISVPASLGGYHLIIDRCCRNNNIVNLSNPGNTGQAFYAFIPPTNVSNNSPTFSVAPVPFLCTADTVTILNSANDPDGDSLVYSFVTPFWGISSNTNPAPAPPLSYVFPIPPVSYAPTYTQAQPFGPGGYAAVNPQTGLTSYLSPNTGFYVVAVEIQEYRNGVLIGITRRDLQLIFITCPANPAPNLSAVGGSGQTTYTIFEGQTLCFPITFTDPNGDSLYVNYSGNIFDSTIVNPAAMIIPNPIQGDSTVTGQFCWTTSCNQGQTTPYTFSISAIDNGCPAKTTNVVYTINVVPFVTAAIQGTDTICANQLSNNTYTIAGPPGATYNWTVTNGTQVSGGTSSTITVNWTGANPATLTASGTSAQGCPGGTVNKTVFFQAVPTSNAGTDVTFCSGANANLGTGSTAGYTYSWSPPLGLNNSSISNPNVTLTNGGSNPVVTPYIVTTSNNGCSSRDTTLVTVNPLPVANAGTNQSLCNGTTSVSIGTTPVAGNTYSWSPIGGLSNPNIANPTITYNNTSSDPDTIIYTVTVTNAFGCTASASVQVIVRPVPVALAGTDQIYCSGQSAVIGAPSVPGYTYAWSPPNGLSSTSTSMPTVSLTNVGTTNVTFNYVLTTTWFGCTANDTVAVTIKPLPIADAGANQSVCSGDTVQLGTSTTAGYTYNWSPPGGLSNTTISNPTVIVNNPGPGQSTLSYTVTATLNGCTRNDSVVITINPLPNVAASASQPTICSGFPTTLSASGANSYNWATLSNPGVSIGTGSSITVSPSSTTSYIVTGSSSSNCIDKDTITVTVNPLPIVTASAPNDTICVGDTINLSANGASLYSWALLSSPGTPVGSGSSLQISPVTNTSYIVTGTDGNGCVNRDTIAIVVNPAPTANSILGTLSVCPGVQGVSYWVPSPGAGSLFNWGVLNGNIAFGQGTDTVWINWDSLGQGLVYVIETNQYGCTGDTIWQPVNINIILTPAMPTGISSLCANQASNTIYTTNNTPQSTYNWNIQGGTIISGNGSNTVTVNWNLTGPAIGYLWYEELSITTDTICFGVSDTLAITINPAPTTSAITGPPQVCVFDSTAQLSVSNTSGSSYNWSVSPGNILSGSGSNAITAVWNSSSVYTAYVIETNSFGCVGDTVFTSIIVNPLPAASAGNDTSFCDGNNVQLQAGGGVLYQWSPPQGLNNVNIGNPIANPSSTTTYTVLVTDNNGCSNSDSVIVTVNPLPPADAGADAGVCLGSSITLQASGGVTYSWTPIGSLDNANIPNPVATPSVTTTYTVLVTDANGCEASDSVSIMVFPLPVAVASADTVICDGSAVNLNASGGVVYSWDPPNDLNDPNIANPIATPSATTTYTVTVTDLNGCTDDDDVTINVDPQPEASFTYEDSVTCAGVTLFFTNTSTGANNYIWDFGDGDSSSDMDPIHFYPFEQIGTITLIATYNNCTDTATLSNPVLSLQDYLNGTPNVFTPNNDGKNDCFSLDAIGDFAECSSVRIFNRWGKLVFEKQKGNFCWDGKDTNGKEVAEGVYFYLISVKSEQLQGSVHLFR